jgi:hypothetical protein
MLFELNFGFMFYKGFSKIVIIVIDAGAALANFIRIFAVLCAFSAALCG